MSFPFAAAAEAWLFDECKGLFAQNSGNRKNFGHMELAPALLRELIQNVFDACRGKKAEVSFSFRHIRRSDLELLGIGSLAERTVAGGESEPSEGDLVRVLEISDNGSGLNGEYLDRRAKSAFNRFMRKSGVAGKGLEQGGRHGVGRIVANLCSRLGGTYVLTVRSDDGKILLSGMADVGIHSLGDASCEYEAIGLYGMRNPSDGGMLPFEGDDAMAIGKLLGTKRKPGQTGLSTFIVDVSEELTVKSLLHEALRRMFVPVHLGKLTINICDESKNVMHRLTQKSLLQIAESQTTASCRDLGDIAILTRLMDQHFSHPVKSLNIESIDLETRTGWCADLDEGKAVRVSVPVVVKDRGQEDVESPMTVTAVRNTLLTHGYTLYIRDSIVVVHRSASGGSAVAVEVSNSTMSHLLGDAENASHTEWSYRNTKEHGRTWMNAESVVDAFRAAPSRFLRILASSSGEIAPDGLFADYFLDEEPGPGLPVDIIRKTPGEKAEAAVGGNGSRDFSMTTFRDGTGCGFVLDISPGNLSYRRNMGSPDSRYATFVTGYDHPKSLKDGIKGWSPSDFELSRMTFETTDCVCTAEGNRLVVTEIGPDMRIVGRGLLDTQNRRLAFAIEERGR